MRPQTNSENPRVVASIPFVEQLARRVAATMPHSIDVGDLVQDGVIGLIDAAHRFDESRGIKFETFAERRIRGAMIDALRKDAWPRGVRRQRRELEAAREELRRANGCEPSLADLAAKMGSDEKRLGRTIVRISAIESTSPMAKNDNLDESTLPAALIPSMPEAPDAAYERSQTEHCVRTAIESLPAREQKVIGLYYYGEATMKQIGSNIGVNESRVSQLHARAIRRLRESLERLMPLEAARTALRGAILEFQQKSRIGEAMVESAGWSASGGQSSNGVSKPGVVVNYPSAARIARSKSALRSSKSPRQSSKSVLQSSKSALRAGLKRSALATAASPANLTSQAVPTAAAVAG
jgi:RNA polymerase sigma factor for flagellar operon FliA